MAIESVVGKLNAQALKKAVEKSNNEAGGTGASQPFSQVLQDASSGGNDFANMLGIGETSPTDNGLDAMSAESISFDPMTNITEVGAPEGSSKVLHMLSEVNKGQNQMDSLVHHVMYSGKRFNNQELLVIQAHVFHFAQMAELTVKVAEQGVSSVRTVLNTQVQ